VRRGIVACLGRHKNLEIVGEAADGQEALSKARELVPDVLLTDLDMPYLTGLAVTETLRKELPDIKVLILSGHTNPESMLRCARAGARGYVLKHASPDEFAQAIEAVNAGQCHFSNEIVRSALNYLVRDNGPGPSPTILSNREREVLGHIAEGLGNKEIAHRLNISTRTVETHRERLMRKLDIHSIAGLTRFAIAEGLATLPGVARA